MLPRHTKQIRTRRAYAKPGRRGQDRAAFRRFLRPRWGAVARGLRYDPRVELAQGVRDVGRGLGALRAHPGLWKLVLAPAALTLVLMVAVILGALWLVDPLVGWLVAHLPGWLGSTIESVARAVLKTAVVVGLAAGAMFVFVAVAGMITGPFNELLSERLEARLTGRAAAPFALGDFVRDFVVGVLHGLRRLVASLFGLVLVFALGFVPVIGTIAAVVIGLWITARGAAYDCYDAVLARRGLRYRDKLAYLAQRRQRSLGLGAAVAGLLFVPGLNLVALGLGAAGATLAVLERDGASPRKISAQVVST